MAIHTMYPAVDVRELELAVNLQFNAEISEMRNLLFDDYYQNDCYKLFFYGEMEEYEDWMGEVDERAIRQRNLVRAYLQDTIPDYEYVLIDVSW